MMGNVFGAKSYEYAVGCIKATSHPPLTPEQLRRLSDADEHDLEKLLDEFGWGKGIEGKLHERIEGEVKYAISFIKDISPDETLTDLLFFEEDAGNLKLFIKGRLLGRDVTSLANESGSIPVEVIRGSVEAWDFTLISETVNDILKDYEKEKDPFILSMAADRAIFTHTLEKAKKQNRALYEMLIKYAEAKNRIAEARLKSVGGDTGKIRSLLLPVSFDGIDTEKVNAEEIIKGEKDKIARAMYDLRSGENFAPIAEYFFAKKEEGMALRRLLAGLNSRGKE
ncbi:MAG: V-type ATPase subunit [Clostridia bacterium]|nr:V-type ATPase subunit [Clostridia bacterium]